MGIPAHHIESHARDFLADQGQDLLPEPQNRVDVGSEIHLAGEDECGVRFPFPVSGRVVRGIDAVGNDSALQTGHQFLKSLAVGVRHHHHPIQLAASLGLVPHQLSPLHEGIERSQPPIGTAPVSLKGPSLEQVLGIDVVEYDRWL